MTTNDALPLCVRGVRKDYVTGAQRVHALAGIDLEVAAGELVAIMGPSGSGKSTLMHAISGLTDVDAGSILVAGNELTGLSDAALTRFRRRNIGLVFQAFNLVPSLSAEDNVRLPALGDRSVEPRVEQLLQTLDLGPRRRHRPDALSGGEQQRVAIARALVMDPAIVLADEPTGSLDSVAGQELCRLFRALCDDHGRTIVVVTHEPTVAMWADRVVVMRDGKRRDDFVPTRDFDAQAISSAYQRVLAQGEA